MAWWPRSRRRFGRDCVEFGKMVVFGDIIVKEPGYG